MKALNELHAQKVRSLMKSVNSLKAKVAKMTRDNKQNKLAVRIQSMQKQHRELELVIDVLKGMMCESGRQWSRAEVDAALIKRATGGPKRFRPKIREELELEVRARAPWGGGRVGNTTSHLAATSLPPPRAPMAVDSAVATAKQVPLAEEQG